MSCLMVVQDRKREGSALSLGHEEGRSFPLQISLFFMSLSGFFSLQDLSGCFFMALHTIPIKFSSILSPTSPLFSGWNWTPRTLPFRTDDEKGQMYPVVVIVYSGAASA